MAQDSGGKLFGRYHDIFILGLGFILTTIVGGYLSHGWQQRAAEIQREADKKEYELQAATKIFDDLSRLMDKRLYRMRRVHLGLGNDIDDDIMRRRWDAYREVLFEWNESLNRNLAMVQMYFGPKAREILENDIQNRFIEFGGMLESSRNHGYTERQKVADDLNNHIYNFDLLLIDSIQRGIIGSSLQQ